VAAGLGEQRDNQRVGEALARWLTQGDPSYFVEAEAAHSLGRTRSPLAMATLPSLLGRRSFQDVIRTRTLEGLGATGDERAMAVVKAEWRPGGSFLARRAIVMAMAELGTGTPAARQAREFIEGCLHDGDFRVRAEAASSLARLGQVEAVPSIERARAAELDGRAKRRMSDAIRDLQEGGRTTEQLKKAQDELDRLRADSASLRERIEKLEARLDSTAPPAPGTPDRGPSRKPKRPRPITRRGPRPHRPVRR
jgi:hypothetical protein